MSSAVESSSSKIVLVMLATGKQGTGVVRALAKINDVSTSDLPWTILAQTRDISSSKSQALAALRGVRLVQGSADAPEALFGAAPGPVYAVYSVQLGLDNPRGLAGEVEQAKLLADAAATHGVQHFVYAGGNFGGAPDNTQTYVPHLDTKRIAEEYLKNTHPTLRTTILRPVTFMDQLVQGDPASVVSRLTKIMFLCQLKPTTRVQFVAASDVGAVAALALQRPEEYVGRVVDVAGDALAPADLEAGWREVFGVELRPNMLGGSALSWAVRTATKDLRLMFKFFNEIGYNADVAACREMYPAMKDWKTFLRTEVEKPVAQ
ncbi:NAD(P)-binding protein [Mycena maculata]|uniref:NAD(P)-binding protein n=1 Tax=Mycena maculata TaxID=230809 RepID=A0AAD7NST3_9AGAR|nr:NAD(P)-binding protein [Mycena maculata]